MFEGHFGLRENPFVAAHQSRFIYPSPEHQEALAHLRYGIENREPFVLITGEVGTGKTTALFDALSEWEGRAIVGLITNSSLTRAELLEEIALRLGMSVSQNASKPQIMVALERHLLTVHQEGLRAILLLDEAQNLERELLEEIRLLSNLETGGEKLVQIFLVGQPELEGRLQLPELRQLRQRIAVHYRLRPLGAADAERYIHHRIAVAGGHALSIFPPDACAEVHRLTHGIPREMNHLCSQSMVCAFVESAPAVLREHVRAAAEELEFQSVLGKERRTRHVTPAVERRQGPTIPGAAPPPERETKSAVQKPAPPAAGPPNPVTPPASHAPADPTAEEQPPVLRPEPAPAAPADRGPDPSPAADPPAAGAWRPDALGEDDAEEGPPRWNPAEFELRTNATDGTGDSDAAPEFGAAEEFEELEDLEVDEQIDVDVDEDDVGPETGPPRLGAPAAEPDAGRHMPRPATDAPEPQASAGATPPAAGTEPQGIAVPPREVPAPAASGDDWQSWFKSLTSEAESSVHTADAAPDPTSEPAEEALSPPRLDDPDAEAGPEWQPHPALAEPRAHVAAEPAHAPEPESAPSVIEPATSTSAFAAALRRAQDSQSRVDEANERPDRAAAALEPQPQPSPAPRRARTLREDSRALESLPPRLRERMAQAAAVPREPNPLPTRIAIAAGLLLVVIAGAILAQRALFPGAATPEEGEPSASAPANQGNDAGTDVRDVGGTAPAPGAEQPRQAARPDDASVPRRGASAGSSPPAAQATARPQAPAPEQPAHEPAPPPPGTTFVLAVGTYLYEARAQEEQIRLSSSTSWQARVATVQEDNVAMFRVTMGDFPTRSEAERVASDLISRGLVDEARIIPVRGR